MPHDVCASTVMRAHTLLVPEGKSGDFYCWFCTAEAIVHCLGAQLCFFPQWRDGGYTVFFPHTAVRQLCSGEVAVVHYIRFGIQLFVGFPVARPLYTIPTSAYGCLLVSQCRHCRCTTPVSGWCSCLVRLSFCYTIMCARAYLLPEGDGGDFYCSFCTVETFVHDSCLRVRLVVGFPVARPLYTIADSARLFVGFPVALLYSHPCTCFSGFRS